MLQKKNIRAVLLAWLWIGFSEFLRNQALGHSWWVEQYQSLGIVFPERPINGVVWMVWSLFFAGVIFIVLTKFTVIQTTLILWFIAFIMMWVVLANLGVLPYKLLIIAVPLSFIEVYGAAWIIDRYKA